MADIVADTVEPIRLEASFDRYKEKRGWTKPLPKKIHLPGLVKYSALSKNGDSSQKIVTQVPIEIIELV
jgi:hypothetical protein